MRTLATLYVSLGAVNLPIAYDLGPAADTCSALLPPSPLDSPSCVHYTPRMNTYSFFPVGTSLSMELQIVDDSGAVVCSRFPVQIVPQQTC